ncbi:MAG: thiamine-phosphate kinase [Bacteroidales bacterium]|nr:thiamine-phosphate kinase [Bacteroidales bacterium]
MKDTHKHSDEISDLGEFGLIRHLTRDLKIKNKSTCRGIGDDAAVLNFEGSRVVISSDLLAEGVHFNLVYTPLKHLGYKAAVVNFSDIYAMNAQPRQLLVSLAISRKFTVSMIDSLFSGIRLACEQYGVDLVGGDTTSSYTGLTISCTAVGEAADEELVYRNGAGKTDLICVSGDLGGAYMGLQLLERERKLFEKEREIQPALEGYDYVLERQLKPEARRDITALFRELGIQPTAMIDISDGLSSELIHICQNSDKGCRIFSDKIPVHPETERVAREFGMEPLIAALNGGEDYELLFTLPVKMFEKIGNRQEVSIIGHMVDVAEDLKMITAQGEAITLEAQGWNALR